MKKLLILSGLLFFVFVYCNGQTPDTDWGPFNTLEKGDNIEKVIGADKDGYFAIRSTKVGALFLEYFNGATNTIESSKEFIMPTAQGANTEFERMFYIGGQLILFTSAYDNGRKVKVCYIQYINKDATLNNKPKEIANVIPTKGAQDFNFMLSEDQTKIILYYHKSFVKYAAEPVTVKVFDATLTDIYNKNIEFPLKEREFTINKMIMGASGDFYFLVKAVEENKKKSSKATETGPKNYEFHVLHYNTKKDEFKPYEIELQKATLNSANMILNDKEEIVVMGFTGKKNSPEMAGAFYKHINPRTFKVSQGDPKTEVLAFSPEITQEFRKERNGGKDEKVENFYKYNMNQMFILKNGTTVIVAEHAYSNSQVISNPTTKQEEKYTQYFFNDILLAAADKDGKVIWVKRICKNQFSRDDDGKYGSYTCNAEGNQIKFIYNDNPKNLKENKINGDNIKVCKGDDGQAVILTLFQDGSYEKSPLFKDDDAKCLTLPNLLHKTKDSFIVFCKKSNKYKFGRFFLQ